MNSADREKLQGIVDSLRRSLELTEVDLNWKLASIQGDIESLNAMLIDDATSKEYFLAEHVSGFWDRNTDDIAFSGLTTADFCDLVDRIEAAGWNPLGAIYEAHDVAAELYKAGNIVGVSSPLEDAPEYKEPEPDDDFIGDQDAYGDAYPDRDDYNPGGF